MLRILGNEKRGLLFIVSGPSGAGKTTLVNRLLAEFSCIKKTVSYTTRPPRPGEVDGYDYCFVAKEEFARRKHAGEFLETVERFSGEYGTSHTQIEDTLNLGYHLVLVIDVEGATRVKVRHPATTIFIRPPSLDVLKARLSRRKTEDEEECARRSELASYELLSAKEYDYQIINEQLEVAYEVLKAVFIAEEHRTSSGR